MRSPRASVPGAMFTSSRRFRAGSRALRCCSERSSTGTSSSSINAKDFAATALDLLRREFRGCAPPFAMGSATISSPTRRSSRTRCTAAVIGTISAGCRCRARARTSISTWPSQRFDRGPDGIHADTAAGDLRHARPAVERPGRKTMRRDLVGAGTIVGEVGMDEQPALDRLARAPRR